jgi:hypothetical protein
VHTGLKTIKTMATSFLPTDKRIILVPIDNSDVSPLAALMLDHLITRTIKLLMQGMLKLGDVWTWGFIRG